MTKIKLLVVTMLTFSLLVSCHNELSSSSSTVSEPSDDTSEQVEGKLEVKNVYQYLGFDPVIIPIFMDQKRIDHSSLYFDILDKTICSIESGYVIGKRIGETKVFASTESGQEVSFNVKIQDPSSYKYYRNINTILESYQIKGEPKNPTLFIGDSFFDIYFWSTFYDGFTRDQNVFLAGISGSKASDWQMLKQKLIFDFEPKNIVIHIGSNDVYDAMGLISINQFYEVITEFLANVCEELPTTQVYYFGIENRTGNSRNAINEQVTGMIKAEFTPLFDNFTYLDSPSVINLDQNHYLISDGIHPSSNGYAYYIQILNDIVHF